MHVIGDRNHDYIMRGRRTVFLGIKAHKCGIYMSGNKKFVPKLHWRNGVCNPGSAMNPITNDYDRARETSIILYQK